MGKRARKTRWRALDIADEHSDSEESNTNSSAVSSRNSHSYSNGHYSKYPYSSQSTPARRRYHQYDGSAKSTRSSSTTSENKITFNEDEYTRITTPRQDVLFKKGYLNKPKSYQTSTGNSTISTGNSTENGTPDHQSTDLDYESQFMFPNGFVDQTTGIYYVNSYEPYPLMLFNPPTYYHECTNIKAKRTSTGSLSESMSPNTEEVASQDLSPASGGDASNCMSDYSSGQPVYNMVFPGYYVNGACTPTGLTNGHQTPPEPVKKLKKRRERRTSKNIQEDSSEYTDENSCDESRENATSQRRVCHATEELSEPRIDSTLQSDDPPPESLEQIQVVKENHEKEANDLNLESKTDCTSSNIGDNTLLYGCAETKTEPNDEKPETEQQAQPKSSVLKPDAEEFIPRSYLNIGPPHHIKLLSPNFVPIPLVPFNDLGGQNFVPHPAFIPPGIPINFIPHPPGQKMFPPVSSFVNYGPPMIHETKIEENIDQDEEVPQEEQQVNESTATPAHTPLVEESKPVVHSKVIDIATVVSKLEAVKQKENDLVSKDQEEISQPAVNESKPFVASPRTRKSTNYRKDFYNRYRRSPSHSGDSTPPIHNENYHSIQQNTSAGSDPSTEKKLIKSEDPPASNNSPVHRVQPQSNIHSRNSPARHVQEPQVTQQNGHHESAKVVNSFGRRTYNPKLLVDGRLIDKSLANGSSHTDKPLTAEEYNHSPISPERVRRNWNNGHQNGYSSPRRVFNNHQRNQSYQKMIDNGYEKHHIKDHSSPNYSETIKRTQNALPTQTKNTSSEKYEKQSSKALLSPQKSEQLKPKSNQWISVSSRKKKKNKNLDEVDFEIADVSNESTEAGNVSPDFESYDVTQLVDVVPSENDQQPEQKLEDILSIIAQNESDLLVNGQQTVTDIKIPEVSDIEKDIIEKIEEQKVTTADETSQEIETLNKGKENEMISKFEEEDQTVKPKKKSKKGTQKPLTKKVIITDIDLSMTVNEVKTPIKKIVTKVEEISTTKTLQEKMSSVEVPTDIPDAKESTPEQSEKKSRKKKKNKSAKSTLQSTTPSIIEHSHSLDDSYDLLLEKSLSAENTEKTNDDISLELEKLIQKGMFNSIQEKIKSINVEPETDEFFKTFQAVSSPAKEKPTTTNAFMKAPDFNRIFQSTRQLLKPNMVSVDHDITDIKVAVDDVDNKDTKSSSSAPDAANPSPGLFLDNTKEVHNNHETTTDVKNEPLISADNAEDAKKLYPITQAVKEWMSKTREATPEVEILKSPFTIQREFGDVGSLDDSLGSDEDDEITLFATDENSSRDQPDLLDYWDNEVASKDILLEKCAGTNYCGSSKVPKVCTDGEGCAKCKVDSIKGKGEEIEIYESKYGQNKAVLELQKELKENERPSNGLPYRTVCCSLQ